MKPSPANTTTRGCRSCALPKHLLKPLEAISRGFHQKLHLTIHLDLALPVIESFGGLQAHTGHKPTFEKRTG